MGRKKIYQTEEENKPDIFTAIEGLVKAAFWCFMAIMVIVFLAKFLIWLW